MSEVKLGATIQPACLPPSASYKPTADIPAWIAGWGLLKSEGRTPDNLQNLKITYYSSGYECRNYDNLNFVKQICAGKEK